MYIVCVFIAYFAPLHAMRHNLYAAMKNRQSCHTTPSKQQYPPTPHHHHPPLSTSRVFLINNKIQSPFYPEN